MKPNKEDGCKDDGRPFIVLTCQYLKVMRLHQENVENYSAVTDVLGTPIPISIVCIR